MCKIRNNDGTTEYIIQATNIHLRRTFRGSKRQGEVGAQPNISRVKLVEHLIPLPPLIEQKRIVKRIETLFEQLH